MVGGTPRALVALVFGASLLIGAQDALAKGDYGPQKKLKREKGPFDTSAAINTTNKPMPAQNYVDVIYAHSGNPMDPDSNWADGGFYLDTSGSGQTIHASGSSKHHVSAPLVGYGSTTVYWIYEIQGLMVGDSTPYKVYVAVKQQYAPGSDARLFISLGKNDPTDMSSFEPAGYAIRGTKEP